ncbi:unnamed protein product, partial [Polarella glacialis]
ALHTSGRSCSVRPAALARPSRHFASSFQATQADLELVLQSKPWPPWLAGEMRSNWAGETGAAAIYRGCQAALPRIACPQQRAALAEFAEEHVAAEEAHLAAMEIVVCEPGERSWMPAASFGWALGYASTAGRGARGMYVTTHAVESFVEEHYGDQITQIVRELDSGENSVEREEALRSLLALLRAACADEVHHKEEAKERACALSTGGAAARLADRLQFLAIYWGSRVGAEMAKRI